MSIFNNSKRCLLQLQSFATIIYHCSDNYAAWLLSTRVAHTNQSELTRTVIGLQGDNRKSWIKQNPAF